MTLNSPKPTPGIRAKLWTAFKAIGRALAPPPEGNKDRLRWFMIAGIFGSGVIVTLAALGYTLIIWLGEWSGEVEAARLNFLGAGLVIAWFTIIVVVVTYGLGGPLGRIKGSIGNINIEAEGDANVENPRD